ncbi:hypothetical protein jhhlp_005924 [Lomentospora prolificans]|uniref:Uncharacterized protein n=1 Tax=Lomentospora prolificans TaxID=41688 RepID=A0A2N3N4J3_9PEZI|nr:hypothetical protein jhhlp_005924 [Lomentospora prolificans]
MAPVTDVGQEAGPDIPWYKVVSTPGNPQSYEHVVETNEWLRYMVEKHDLPTLRVVVGLSGNIIASNIYREDDKPLYRRGNSILLGICCWNVLLFYLVKAFYIWRNRTRERKWSALSKEEQEDYLLHTTDEGMKRLDFRFAH